MSEHPPAGGDALPPPPGGRDAGDGPPRSRTRRSGGPNYVARRIGTLVALLVVIVVSVVVIARAFTGDDGGSSIGNVDARWTDVVVLTDDAISLVDPGSGEVVAEYPANGSLLDDQSLVAGRMLVTMTDFGRIEILDLDDGSVRRGQAGVDETLVLSRDHDEIALVAPDVGGDVTVIDVVDRQILSVGDVAGLDSPLMFLDGVRINPAGTHLAVSDARSFQTIVVELDEQAALPLAGQIVDINDDVVVTAQRAGGTTEFEYYDLTGERQGSVDLPTPVAAMLTDDDVVSVDASGAIRVTGSGGSDEQGTVVVPVGDDQGDETAGEPASPSSGVGTGGRTRLVVTDDRDTWVIDDRGEQLGHHVGTAVTPIDDRTRCITVDAGRLSTVIEVGRGEALAELDRLTVLLTSVDGCSMALIGAGEVVDQEVDVRLDGEPGTGTLVWVDGDVIEVLGDSVIAMAPDGAAVAVNDGPRTLLVDLDDGAAIELTTELAVIRFAER